MTTLNPQQPRFPERPQTAADLANALRAIADKLAALGGAPMPNLYVSIDIQPSGDEDAEIAAIDQLGTALYGQPGEDHRMSGGSVHHAAKGYIAGVSVDAYCSVADPEVRKLQAEVEQLRAQLAGAPVNETANPDRRCRRCGATSGLRLLPSNPLTLDPREWECRDGCAGGAA